MTRFHCIDELGRPFEGGGQNNFDLFEEIADRYGVYIFSDGSGDIIYVGEAHKQTLKERIAQYYTESDTGGTFRKNWCKCGNRQFSEFKQALDTWKLEVVSTQTRNANWIRPLETRLIQTLGPKYNKTS